MSSRGSVGIRGSRIQQSNSMYVLAVMLAVLPFGRISAQTVISPGNAGQVHAAAFDPDDPNAIYVGGDVSGVHRTLDFGQHWELWSNGLVNSTLTKSYYVDDLLVLGQTSGVPAGDQGVYAATWAGVYFRPTGGSAWTCQTPMHTYSEGFAGTAFCIGADLPIPFSSLAYDAENQVLYAGAGHGRIISSLTMDTFYPEAVVDSSGIPFSPQYSLWRKDLAAQGDWEPVLETDTLGMVRQIAVVRVAGGNNVVFATSRGVFTYEETDSPPLEVLWPGPAIATLGLVGWSKDPWGVAAGDSGYAYALMSKSAIVTAEGDTIPTSSDYPGVYKVELSTKTWSRVGDLAQPVYPHGSAGGWATATWDTILTHPLFAPCTLTVIPGGGEPDQVYIGNRSNLLGGGYYRYGQYYISTTETVTGWVHAHLASFDQLDLLTVDCNAAPISCSELSDLGWMVTVQIPSLIPWLVHPNDAQRMLVFDYHFPLVTDDGGSTWSQVYCSGMDGAWSGNGLELMCARESRVRADGRLLLGNADVGAYQAADASNTSFDWMHWPKGGWPDVLDIELVRYAGEEEIFMVLDPTYATGSADASAKAGYAVAYYDSLGSGTTDEWDRITDPIEAWYLGQPWDQGGGGKYNIYDMEPVGTDSMFVTVVFDQTELVTITDPVTGQQRQISVVVDLHPYIFLGTRTEEATDWEWDWSSWWQAQIAGVPYNGIRSLEFIPNTRTLLVGAVTAHNFQSGLNEPGGLFALDLDVAPAAPVIWVDGSSAAGASTLQEMACDILCITADPRGQVVYVGTDGPDCVNSRGKGGIFRYERPFDGGVPVPTIIANAEGEDSFGFQATQADGIYPAGNEAEIQDYLTRIYEIVIHPANPYVIFTAMGNDYYSHEKYGVWRYETDQDLWTQLTGAAALNWNVDGQAIGPRTVALSTQDPAKLYVGTSGQGYFEATVDTVAYPSIATTAEFPILADNPDTSSAIAVMVTHPNGYTNLRVTADLSDLGGPAEVLLANDGIYPDLAAADSVYTTPLLPILVPSESETVYVPVFAQAEIDSGGDGSYAWEDSVAVEVVESALKFADGSEDTGDLYSVMSGEPYSSVYIETQMDGVDYGALAITKDDIQNPPQVFGYHNLLNGSPSMVDMAPFWFVALDMPTGGRGLTAGDYDQDGAADLFIGNNRTDIDDKKLYRNTGSGFVDATGAAFDSAGRAALLGAHVVAWGDYNRDGFLDLFVACNTSTGTMMAFDEALPTLTFSYGLFKGTVTGEFKAAATGFMGTPVAVLSASWNDVNGDGWLDLALAVYTMDLNNPRIYKNLGTIAGTNDCAFELKNWGREAKLRSLNWIDHNHDDLLDLLVVETDNSIGNFQDYSRAAVLFYDPTGPSMEIEELVPGDPTAWLGSLVGDLNLDGHEDRILLPQSGMPSIEISEAGAAVAEYTYRQLALPLGMKPTFGETPAITSGGVCADFNGDHDLDIFMGRPKDQSFFFRTVKTAHLATAQNQALNDTLQANWAQIHLVSVGNSNRSAIGARVTLYAGDLQQTKLVDGGSGRGGQTANQLIFGLGDYSGPLSATVRWPSGVTETDIAVDLNAETLIPEPKGVAPLTAMQILAGSAKFTYQLFPGGADWIFQWDTDLKGDLTKDRIDWYYAGSPPIPCQGADPGTYGVGDPNVEIVAYPITTGWRHKLTLRNQICSPVLCPFAFIAHSEVDSVSVNSPAVTFGGFKTCLSQ